MLFNKTNLETLNKKAIEENDGLAISVCEHLLDKIDEYNDPKNSILEILEHGCVGGAVSELIYYSDTTAYYAKHKDQINSLLYETMAECGIYDLKELFGHGDVRWDKEDPLALDYYNQNILAWFAFEETTRKIAMQFEDLEELV